MEANNKLLWISEKIDSLLAKLNYQVEQNSVLQNEVTTLRALNDAKDIEISRLNENITDKNAKIEEIASKLELIIGDEL